jgi:hypothetical protein
VARLPTLSKTCVWVYAGFTINRHFSREIGGELVRLVGLNLEFFVVGNYRSLHGLLSDFPTARLLCEEEIITALQHCRRRQEELVGPGLWGCLGFEGAVVNVFLVSGYHLRDCYLQGSQNSGVSWRWFLVVWVGRS